MLDTVTYGSVMTLNDLERTFQTQQASRWQLVPLVSLQTLQLQELFVLQGAL